MNYVGKYTVVIASSFSQGFSTVKKLYCFFSNFCWKKVDFRIRIFNLSLWKKNKERKTITKEEKRGGKTETEMKAMRKRPRNYGKTASVGNKSGRTRQGKRENSVCKKKGRLQKKSEENRSKQRVYRRKARQQESAKERESRLQDLRRRSHETLRSETPQE